MPRKSTHGQGYYRVQYRTSRGVGGLTIKAKSPADAMRKAASKYGVKGIRATKV